MSVEAHTDAAVHAEHPPTNTGMSHPKVGMWTFLASECLLFGALISTYLLYRGRVGEFGGPIPHDVYDIPFTSVSSFVLLMSSLTMVLALAAIQKGDERRLRVWLVATALLLGMVFISGQVYEFTSFVEEGLNLRTNVASTAFFVLTGFQLFPPIHYRQARHSAGCFPFKRLTAIASLVENLTRLRCLRKYVTASFASACCLASQAAEKRLC